MINIQQYPLWDISIYEAKMPNFQSIKQELVDYLKVCELQKPNEIAGIGPHEQIHKKHLEESYPTLFNNTDSNVLNEVKDFCLNVTLNIVKDVNSPFTDTSNWSLIPTDSWYHITKDRGYHDNHDHPDSTWCGLFYVDKGDANNADHNGINRFYSPYRVQPSLGNEYMNNDFYDVEIDDGKLVVFPGWLEHSALPYYGDKERIILSYNTIFRDDI